ncbi:MAG: HD-like signal output (HDOD) protein [Cellvibrionaceae bacterium]|jgi:HD-like signal output (HDOD) protein
MQQVNFYNVYKTVVEHLINNQEQLPSLPSITLKIRRAIADPNATNAYIAKLIQLDPSLSALLLRQAASPIYRREIPARTIDTIMSMIGLPALEGLVMQHSIKSLFVMKSPKLKKLFRDAWERMIYKAAISLFLAKKLGFRNAEEAMSASILSEVGTLAVLSAFSANIEVPDQKIYVLLCKKYSKSLSTILLHKWGLDNYLVSLTQSSGNWSFSKSNELGMIDIINLAIYTTVQHRNPDNDLPRLEDISAYQKLPATLNKVTESKQLAIIESNLGTIDNIFVTLK